jgi:lipopolysaccharide/colanic/teichoic acid biosynthesis glycosyltransferase
MLVAALAIKIEDGIRAPVLYRQLRVGKEGSTFTVLKFRSMQLDAEADGIARWASPEDARVTRVGRWIRPTRIDELPQLLNILRGDMRFVGPRPERPEFVCEFDRKLPYYRQRHSVRPGLTGWAQLRCNYGASEKDALEKLKYDLYYVKNHNFVFDLVILIQTVEVILFGKGAR